MNLLILMEHEGLNQAGVDMILLSRSSSSIRASHRVGSLYLAFLLALAFAGASGQVMAQEAEGDPQKAVRPPSSDPITGSTLPAKPSKEGAPYWQEDYKRIKLGVEACMKPDEYRRAMISTGMEQYRSGRGRVDDQSRNRFDWVRRGPRGGIGDPPCNGRIAGLEILSSDHNRTFWVGSCQGGLWRMHHDSWDEWEDLGFNLPNPSVRALAVDPSNHDRIVVGTGDPRRYVGSGLYYTTDSGATWTAATTPADAEEYFGIHHHPDNYNDMLAASSEGLFLSTDRGVNWGYATLAGGGDATGFWTDLLRHPSDTSIWYACRYVAGAGAGRGVFRSLDDGQTWDQLADPDLPQGGVFDRASMAICRSQPQHMAIVVENGNFLEGVFRSTDGGINWTSIGDDLVNATFGSNQVGHAQAIAIHPADPDEIYVGSQDLARSLDGGVTWETTKSEHGIEKGHADFTQIFYSPLYVNDVVFFCNDGGIYWHDHGSGDTHSMMGNSASGLACSEIDFMDSDRQTRAIGMQDNGVMLSVDAGDDWSFEASGDGGDVEITDPVDRDFWYVAGVYSSPPSWRTFRKNWGSSSDYTNNPDKYMPRLFCDPFSETMYTHGDGWLWSRPVGGSSAWVQEVDSFQAAAYSTRSFWGSKADGKVFYFVYWNGDTSDGDSDQPDLTVVRKIGGNWNVSHYEDFNPSGESVQTVCTSSEWPDECWVGVKGGAGDPKIYHLRNYGQTVTDITNNLANVNAVNCIAVQPFDPDLIYVGTDLGMFRSTDGGQNWLPFMDGLPIGKCSELRFVLSDSGGAMHELVLAMDGRGVWSRSIISEPVIYVDKNNTGSEDGSFENPFNTVTEGIDAVQAGGIVAVRTNTYQEPHVISKNVKVVTWAGTTVIE